MKSIREMSGKIHEFIITLDKAGITPDFMQLIINCKDNKAARAMANAAAPIVGYEPLFLKFGRNPFLELEITVPDDYVHSTALFNFKMKQGRKFLYDTGISDETFSFDEYALRPGEKYKAEAWSVRESVSVTECNSFLEKKSLIPVGPRGLALFYINKGSVTIFKEDEGDRLYSPDSPSSTHVAYISYRYKEDERHGFDASSETIFFQTENVTAKCVEVTGSVLGFRRMN